LPVEEENNAKLIPVAWDAIVAIVHPDNPVDGITLEQMKSILIGEIKNWQDVGGPDQKIHLVIREGKISGVGLTMRELIFKAREVEFTDDSTAVGSTGPLEEMVETDVWAFGISGISSAKRRQVKILELDGIAPSYENIAAGSYTLFRPLYLVIPKETKNRQAVEDFIAFALSDAGQGVVKQNGTVNLEDGSGLWRPYRENMLNAGVQMGEY
jgi:phosphate transport system substrate-binding protein